MGATIVNKNDNLRNHPQTQENQINHLDPNNPERTELMKDMYDNASLLRRTMRANGIFTPEDMKLNECFFRFPRNDPYNYVDGAREYLFFTKPDLPLLCDGNQLMPECAIIPYFSELFESPGYIRSVFYNLNQMYANDHCPFIRILSNRKTSNMDIPDINVDEMETAVNLYGTRIFYPKSSMASDEGADFTIEFEDTRYCEIYHLFKTWDYYRQLKWLGLVGLGAHMGKDIAQGDKADPAFEHYYQYIYYKILHDHISVYKFLVDNDGETIIFMAKATGVYPKSINRSTFSEIPERGPLKITVGFKVSGWIEDSTPSIVADFNSIMQPYYVDEQGISLEALQTSDSIAAPLYDEDIDFVSQENVSMPFIRKYAPKTFGTSPGEWSKPQDFVTYKLHWYAAPNI